MNRFKWKGIAKSQIEPKHPAFFVAYHNGPNDIVGVPLNAYDRFHNVAEAEAQCAVQMADRTVEQKKHGIYYSVQRRVPDVPTK